MTNIFTQATSNMTKLSDRKIKVVKPGEVPKKRKGPPPEFKMQDANFVIEEAGEEVQNEPGDEEGLGE